MGTTDSYKELAARALPGLVQTLETCINLEGWGFKQSFYGVSDEFNPSVIYDSDKCRVRFIWIDADMRDGSDSATLNILYGRLHASNQKRTIIWNGVNCYCWHDLDNTLYFLDGVLPQDFRIKSRHPPPFIDNFAQLHKGHNWSHVEWGARLHLAIWEYYENRLFNLFDLQCPDLWEKYMLFTKEINQLNPFRDHDFRSPPTENIC